MWMSTSRSTGQVEHNMVTDPYAVALTMNSGQGLLVDLNDPALKPASWEPMAKPPLAAPEDIVLYELHVRDFSVNDPSVPAALRGKFKAFTLPNTNGMQPPEGAGPGRAHATCICCPSSTSPRSTKTRPSASSPTSR